MEELQMFIALVEGTNDLIHCISTEGRFEFVNRAWLEKLDYTPEEVKNLKIEDILYPSHIKNHMDLVSNIMKGDIAGNVEVTFLTKGGELILLEGNLFPHKSGAKIEGVMGFFRDITERKTVEEDLKESRARTEFFVDLMIHDLTNINQEVISTFEILLFHHDFPDELKDIVNEALKEAERGSNLVENVRKISRLYSIVSEREEWDLWETITSAASGVDDAFPEKELVLNTNIVHNQYRIQADEYFRDVFYSLLHNSMKFDEGKKVNVEVEVNVIKHTPFLRIEIKDHGPGIPDEEKELVFDKLTHRRESILGLGLGLSLVKMILENYGAYIRVEDRVEGDHSKGANFVILLRYNPEIETKEVS